MLAVYRLEKLNYELTKLCAALEQAEIPFIPLKGSVLRQYYPEPWMRTSCDIDVFVHEENLKRTISYLTEHLGYSYESQSSHDVSLFSKNRNHIELHYDIWGDNVIDSVEPVLKKMWDVAPKNDNRQYQYKLPEKVVKIDCICFDRFLMRLLSIFENFDQNNFIHKSLRDVVRSLHLTI